MAIVTKQQSKSDMMALVAKQLGENVMMGEVVEQKITKAQVQWRDSRMAKARWPHQDRKSMVAVEQ